MYIPKTAVFTPQTAAAAAAAKRQLPLTRDVCTEKGGNSELAEKQERREVV